jgi:hypothetical protein
MSQSKPESIHPFCTSQKVAVCAVFVRVNISSAQGLRRFRINGYIARSSQAQAQCFGMAEAAMAAFGPLGVNIA